MNEIISSISICVSGSSEMIESFLTEEYADFHYEEYREREFEVPEIEYIFER